MTEAPQPLFFAPDLQPNEVLFAVVVFAGAIAILMDIHPEVVLGTVFLLMVMMFVDVLGPSPFLAIMVIVIAAIVRLGADGGQKLTDASPETLAVLATVLDNLLTTDQDNREDE